MGDHSDVLNEDRKKALSEIRSMWETLPTNTSRVSQINIWFLTKLMHFNSQ